jgi:hypothetical protein
VLQNANHESTHQIDRQNDDAGYSIAAHEFTCTVHRTVEICFLCDFGAAAACFVFTDQPCIQIGVNRHLFARHRIQSEARAHFSDTPCTLGDNHKVDYHQNRKHHDTHCVISSDQEMTERLNHLTGRIRPV